MSEIFLDPTAIILSTRPSKALVALRTKSQRLGLARKAFLIPVPGETAHSAFAACRSPQFVPTKPLMSSLVLLLLTLTLPISLSC